MHDVGKNQEFRFHPRPSHSYALEALEARELLSFGPLAHMVGQDAAVANYPQIDGAGQTVALIDDVGIDYNVPQLGGGLGSGHKVVAGYNFITNSSDPYDYTTDAGGDRGHMTGVAGLIAGGSYSVDGYADQGIAPDANIVALVASTPSQIQAALDYVIANRTTYNIVAVNLVDHLGGTRGTVYDGELQTLQSDGVYIGVPIGNGPGRVRYPAAGPYVYSAGAVDVNGNFSPYNNNTATTPDVLAPGQSVPLIYVTASGAVIYFLSPGEPGTSWASPDAVGIALLIKQVNANFTPAQINSIEQASGTPVTNPATGVKYSLVNVNAAIALAYQTQAGPLPRQKRDKRRRRRRRAARVARAQASVAATLALAPAGARFSDVPISAAAALFDDSPSLLD